MVDEAKLNQFIGKILGDLGGAFSVPMRFARAQFRALLSAIQKLHQQPVSCVIAVTVAPPLRSY
jgi:hypothetical protein